MRKSFFIAFSTIFTLFLLACESKPKVIEAEGGGSNTPIFHDVPANGNASGGMQAPATESSVHHGSVEEVLHTEKYSYLRIKENGADTWIAIPRKEIKAGATGSYSGGLMKKNFMSKEYNRVFETVYLVSEFREDGAPASAGAPPQPTASVEPPKDVKAAPGAIKIADLVANLSKYNGKSVKITGKCVKVNPMIMGRNWVHLQDGSGKNIDLTVTTTDMVQLGSIVTLEGTVALNKDFGAGYKYDYIVEGAVVVK